MRRSIRLVGTNLLLFVFLSLYSTSYSQNVFSDKVIVTTIAGSAGVTGFTNGKGSTALFNNPTGIAVDHSGNIYVSDSNNNLIRKINNKGIVTTLSGAGGISPVFKNGAANNASFDNPIGVAVDRLGNVYVADAFSNFIRKIDYSGVVTNLAGGGNGTDIIGRANPGSIDGIGTIASFHDPFGVAVDSSGNVYIADAENSLIRKITSTGLVTTLAGSSGVTGNTNATGTNASFDSPYGVAVDSYENVYVADWGNNIIRKITSSGIVTTLAGQSNVAGSANGNGQDALFYFPYSVAVDSSQNVYVADSENDLIRKITPAGVVSTLAGQAGVRGSTNGPGAEALFNNPTGVAVDSAGNVYVADQRNNLIRKIQQ